MLGLAVGGGRGVYVKGAAWVRPHRARLSLKGSFWALGAITSPTYPSNRRENMKARNQRLDLRCWYRKWGRA